MDHNQKVSGKSESITMGPLGDLTWNDSKKKKISMGANFQNKELTWKSERVTMETFKKLGDLISNDSRVIYK